LGLSLIPQQESFRDDAYSANVQPLLDRLEGHPRIATVVQHLLVVNPADRWTAHEVLQHSQYSFAVEVQKCWRGYVVRKEYRRVLNMVIRLQAHMKGYLVHRNFWQRWGMRRHSAALRIQSCYRKFREQSSYGSCPFEPDSRIHSL